jgi:EAL domain-containing protein (putative c-di-GMP-specific phosphodiesterase class I)
MLKEKKTRLNKVLLAGNILATIWLACDSIPHFFESTEMTELTFQVKMLMTIILIPLIYYFLIIYSGYFNKWKRHLFILIIPIISIVSWVTNSFPYAFVSDVRVENRAMMLSITFQPQLGLYVFMIYAYTVILICIGILIFRAARGTKDYRNQTVKVVLALSFALMGNGLTLLVFSDITPRGNNTGDMTSIFVFVFFALMYLMVSHSQVNYEDQIMQMTMSEALRKNEFCLFLQPQYKWNGRKYEMVGAEALIRWIKEGAVYKRPDQFIPIAERNGMIIAMGNWVVDEIFRINAELKNKGIDLKLSINVSSLQLKGKSFVKHLEEVKDNYKEIDIDLVIEITESIVLDYEKEVACNLNKIQEMGVQIALDDFGTGYSSLSYLKKLPIDFLKIDKTFIDDVHTDTQSLTPFILDIAKKLRLQTIVEGTELIEQVEILKGHCDYFQGYYFSKPLDEVIFMKKVDEQFVLSAGM